MKQFLCTAVLTLAAVTAATAQVPYAVIAQVPFAFTVGNVSLPAGTYEFRASNNLDDMSVAEVTGKETIVASVISRLSPRLESENEGSVVFDVVGESHYLSEIYIPGLDGFELQGAPVKHTHISIKEEK